MFQMLSKSLLMKTVYVRLKVIKLFQSSVYTVKLGFLFSHLVDIVIVSDVIKHSVQCVEQVDHFHGCYG